MALLVKRARAQAGKQQSNDLPTPQHTPRTHRRPPGAPRRRCGEPRRLAPPQAACGGAGARVRVKGAAKNLVQAGVRLLIKQRLTDQ